MVFSAFCSPVLYGVSHPFCSGATVYVAPVSQWCHGLCGTRFAVVMVEYQGASGLVNVGIFVYPLSLRAKGHQRALLRFTPLLA